MEEITDLSAELLVRSPGAFSELVLSFLEAV
jgi:hypothetical protein